MAVTGRVGLSPGRRGERYEIWQSKLLCPLCLIRWLAEGGRRGSSFLASMALAKHGDCDCLPGWCAVDGRRPTPRGGYEFVVESCS